ncbi:MAG: chromate efflux transporter [Candidatus Omnitrophica bacterium]|nr:chromate efflux transporter [Candidatus Omnitrophota bacterium]
MNRQNNQNPPIPVLFLSFLRLGLTAFGGPAMVAYIKKMAVDRHKWIDEATFKDGVVLCQSIPGSTAMQTAAYVGLRTRNILGAFVSYVGFGLPAFILMLVFSALYTGSHNMPKVVSLFSGLQVIVVAIVAQAAFSFGKGMLKSYHDIFIPVISGILLWIGISPFIVILGAALAGIMFFKKSDTPKAFNQVKKETQIFKQISLIVLFLSLSLTALYFFDKNLFNLAALMFKIDLFAFGGGFAALPLMHHEIVGVRGWMSSKTFMDGIALGQITPGPITMSTTFVGYLLYGFSGAAVATLAIFTPSFLMVVLITPFFDKLKGSPYFLGATRAIYASFVGLLCFVTIKFAYAVPWNMAKILLVLITLVALFKKVDILYVVLVGALASLFIF